MEPGYYWIKIHSNGLLEKGYSNSIPWQVAWFSGEGWFVVGYDHPLNHNLVQMRVPIAPPDGRAEAELL